MLISCNFVIKDQEKTIITLEIWTMRSISESAISEIHFATLTYISSSLLCNRKVIARLDIYHQISSSLKPLCLGTLLMIMMTTSMHYILNIYIYSSFFFFNTFKNCPSLQIFSLSSLHHCKVLNPLLKKNISDCSLLLFQYHLFQYQ